MKKIALLCVSLMLVVGMSAPAFADTTYTVGGFFTMLSNAGVPMRNTSEPYYSSAGYKGFHTPITGTITQFDESNMYPSPNGDGTGMVIGGGTVATFDFFDGSLPANAKGIDLLSPGSYTFSGEVFNVAVNTMGAKMLFDWNGTNNIDVVLQLNPAGMMNINYGGSGAFPDTHWSGFVTHNDGPFSGASMDDQADGITGHPMWNGPFNGSNANFDFNITGVIIPEPASLLLLGSGLVGLIGIARRRNK